MGKAGLLSPDGIYRLLADVRIGRQNGQVLQLALGKKQAIKGALVAVEERNTHAVHDSEAQAELLYRSPPTAPAQNVKEYPAVLTYQDQP